MYRSNKIICIIFVSYIVTLGIFHLLIQDTKFSEFENRFLKGTPNLTIETLTDGSYTTNLETYYTDQFPFRNFWISLKTNAHWTLGYKENNDVFYGKGNILIDKFPTINLENIDKNMEKINAFSSSIDVKLHLSLIPTHNDIYIDHLSTNTAMNMQSTILDYLNFPYTGSTTTESSSLDMTPLEDTTITGSNSFNYIDVYSILYENRENYIYYYSDHHWTSKGAYLAYSQLSKDLGYEPISENDFTITNVSSNFLGSIHSKSPFTFTKLDSIYTYVSNQEINVIDETGTNQIMLYDESKLSTKNQYTYFLGGNPPIAIINGTGSDNILLIRDSYSNALAPFFINHYKEIHLIDLRTCKLSMSEYIKEHQIDQVLILYSIPNFALDSNLAYLR